MPADLPTVLVGIVLSAAVALAGCRDPGASVDAAPPPSLHPVHPDAGGPVGERPSVDSGIDGQPAVPQDVLSFVDPFIGTDDGDSPDPVPGDVGGATFPGAAVPFGMVQWSPDTVGAEFGYHHGSSAISGFSLNHVSGPGCPALLDFPFLPVGVPFSGPPGTTLEPYAAKFSHVDETAQPGYYRVRLGSGIAVRLTATTRTGVGELTFPSGATPGLLWLAGKSPGWGARVEQARMRVVSPREIAGSLTSSGFCNHPLGRYRVHFVARFDRDIAQSVLWSGAQVLVDATEGTGGPSGVYLRWPMDVARVRVRAALSYVSEENARLNLDAEDQGWDVDQVRSAAADRWAALLGKVQVQGGDLAQRRMFYTALYHSFLHPNVFSDVNGDFAGFDGNVHRASGYVHHANFSGWDVYRSWVPLAALLAPETLRDLVRSLLENGRQCGGMPKWSLANDETGVMVGDPASITVASAAAYGVTDFDERLALRLMLASADEPGRVCNRYELRHGLSDYLSRGFVPVEHWGGPAVTLEYALADFAIARFAQRLGEADVAGRLVQRAGNWRHVFNPQTQHVHPRRRDGAWLTPFDPSDPTYFIEGNAAQYTFFVPHDFRSLVEVLGGPERAQSRLDELFRQVNAGVGRPHFYIGNEPQFSTPFAYAFAGAPWKTQEVVRRIVTRAFSDGPRGLPGNDDLGATSSWYAWSVLGLYPAVPGVAGYALASPLFPEVRVTLPNGKSLTIQGVGAGPGAPFVQRLTLDGAEHRVPWVEHQQIADGAVVRFDLAPSSEGAARSWFTAAPPSFMP